MFFTASLKLHFLSPNTTAFDLFIYLFVLPWRQHRHLFCRGGGPPSISGYCTTREERKESIGTEKAVRKIRGRINEHESLGRKQ